MRFWLFSIVIITLCLSFGCGRHGQTGGAAGAPAQLRLGFFPNLTHAQAVLGIASGDFAASLGPVTLKPMQFNAGPSLIEALNAGEIDIGYVGPGPALNAFARSHGQGIRIISGAAANGVIIVAGKDSGINSMADLKGKKIATPQRANTQDIAARHYLMTVLKQTDTNNVLPTPNADQSAEMSRGDIDAAWAPEPWGTMMMATAGAKLVGEEKDLWPHGEFSLTVIVTTPEFLAAHPDLVQKILTVHHSWTQRLNAEPGKYVSQLEDALAGWTGKKLPAGITAQALRRVKFTDEPLEETLQADAQWAYDLQFSKDAPKLDGLSDLTILRQVQAAAPTTQPMAKAD